MTAHHWSSGLQGPRTTVQHRTSAIVSVFDVVFDDELDAREPPLADCDSSCVASFSLARFFSLDELLEDSSERLLE